MTETLRSVVENRDLQELHEAAESKIKPFRYTPPDTKEIKTKGYVQLGHGEIIRAFVQVLAKEGGRNNLHYHTNAETLWYVLKGRAAFYGPEDKLLGFLDEGGAIITPRYSRYWFENAGEQGDFLEILQVAASDVPGLKDRRVDVEGEMPKNLKIFKS